MFELSLYVLDITMNSVRAGAKDIDVTLEQEGDWLTFSVKDNGCGMTAEQVKNLTDPFFTTRKTRKVGLGVPFLTMLSEMTGGRVTVESIPEPNENHGTLIKATFDTTHIDFIPLGDMISTFVTLIQGSPETDFTFIHRKNGAEVRLSCRELREILGEEISLAEPEILMWIRGNFEEQYQETGIA